MNESAELLRAVIVLLARERDEWKKEAERLRRLGDAQNTGQR